MNDEKLIVDLEYNFVCDFIRLRKNLDSNQQQMANECGVIREMIGVIENQKKHQKVTERIREKTNKFRNKVIIHILLI